DPPILLLQGSSYENCSNEDCSIYPEVIDLDTEDEEENICLDDDQLSKDACNFEANYSEPITYNNSEAEKNQHDDRDSQKLVVATSSLGEAKITLMFNATPGSNFRVPTLEALLKRVEQQCLSSYKIPQAGFSLLGLMQDVCECFLAAGTTSTKEPDSEIGLSKANNSQLSLFGQSTVTNDPVFEFSPQIPRLFGSIRFDFSRQGPISLNLESSGYGIVEKRHFYLNINDITKGHEARKVSLINEVNEEKGPKFSYIPKNVTYRNACMSFRLAHVTGRDCCSDCFGDCLGLEGSSCNCACKNGGKFAYTPEGLLKENFLNSFVSTSRSLPRHDLLYCQDCPLERSNGGDLIGDCKGHMNREFIKECWYKCGCGMNCGNRVVQQGITAKLQVFMTSDRKGWGLRTLEDLPKGAFICEYVGEVVTIRELFERNVQKMSNSQTYPVLLDAGWSSKGVLKDDEALCLDATVYGNIARFINHRCCDANLVYVPVEVETPDHHYYHVAFFTTRKVRALEELTWVSFI
ncbi:histone-lysine n-methyltransferase suvr4, partial [Phtheirospermum japonicum]